MVNLKYNWQHPNWPKFKYKPDGLNKVINEYKAFADGDKDHLYELENLLFQLDND